MKVGRTGSLLRARSRKPCAVFSADCGAERSKRPPRRLARHPEEPAAGVEDPVGQTSDRCARSCGLHSAPLRPRSVPSGVGIEDDRADVDRRDAVDERVVGLRDRREARITTGSRRAAALDQVELPERPALVERLRHHPADELAELASPPGAGIATWRTWRRDVEVGVVLPLGPQHLPRQPADPAPEPRDQLEPPATWSRNSSKGGGSPAKIAVPPTWTWIGPARRAATTCPTTRAGRGPRSLIDPTADPRACEDPRRERRR